MTLANATVRAAVRIVYRRQYRAFLEATKEPRAAQTALLRRIVAANADTDFRQGARLLPDRDDGGPSRRGAGAGL